MGSIDFQKAEYQSYGKCLQVSNEKIRLVIALEFGIRILYFGKTGSQNMFCNAPDMKVAVKGEEWKMYGGHRLWVSPETESTTYFPDNKPVRYRINGEEIILQQPLDEWANVRKELTIRIEDEVVVLNHRIINKNNWPVELAAWAVTVMASGGTEIIPFSAEDSGYLPNRNISVWPYTSMSDPRVKWLKDYIVLTQNSEDDKPFKIGIENQEGWAAYMLGGELFIKQFAFITEEGYPDKGVSYETYTGGYVTEMESLSPVKKIGSGDYIEHIEKWCIQTLDTSFDLSSNDQIQKMISRFI